MPRRPPRLRTHARALVLGSAVLAALATATLPVEASARDDDRGRPWARRTIRPSFGFGVGLGRDATQLGFGVGASYFVLNGLAVGLSLSDSVIIFKDSFKSEFPGVHKQIPTNVFRIVPELQYVFFRSRWFSPYVHAGVGPAFFNNKRGTVGYWVAGPGAYIGIGGPVFLNVGVDFFGMFPVPKCNRAFRYEDAAGGVVQFEGYCSFGWSPNIGIVVAFGGGGSKRRSPPRSAPPSNPLPETIEPAPAEPAPVEPPPAEATEPVEPPPEGPAPDGPPPADPAPAGPAPQGPAPAGPRPEGPAPEAPAPTAAEPLAPPTAAPGTTSGATQPRMLRQL